MASPTVARLRNDLASMKTKYRGALSRTRNSPKAKKTTDIAIELAGSAIAGYVATSNMSRIAGIETPLLVGGGLVAFSMLIAVQKSHCWLHRRNSNLSKSALMAQS